MRADFRGSHWSRQITWHESGCGSGCESGCTRSCDLSEPMRALAHPLSHENLTFDSNSTSAFFESDVLKSEQKV